MHSLSIGVNVFECEQWKESKEKLLALKGVKLFALQFATDNVDTSGFTRTDCLKTRACDIIHKSVSKKPLVFEMIDGLSSCDTDFFLFINCDIIVSNKAIEWMTTQKEYDSACFFRVKTGVDGIYIRTNWWKENRHKFTELNYIYAEPAWDAAYAAQLAKESKCFFHNKEYLISHIKHVQRWHPQTVDGKWNSTKFYKSGLNPIWRKQLCSA